MSAVVIGVGSPFGDDAVGLVVARALAADGSLPADVRVLALERPGLDLVDALRGAERCVIVDALRGSAPGRLHRLDAADLTSARAPSSHALGVAEALALAAALGVLPPRLAILGVEVVSADGAGERLSPGVAAAVAPARRAARALLNAASPAAAAGSQPGITGPRPGSSGRARRRR